LHNVSTVNDLGIFVDDRLTFNCHINNIVARASARANPIHKCFTSKDVTTMTRAFVVYVRPLLEYASPVWSPYTYLKIYTVSQKKGATLTMAITLSILDRFAKFFHCSKSSKFPTKLILGYPPHLKYVAALPWKT